MEAIGQVAEHPETCQRTHKISKRTKVPCKDETGAEDMRRSFPTELFCTPKEQSHTILRNSNVVTTCSKNSDKEHAFENTSAQDSSETADGYETSNKEHAFENTCAQDSSEMADGYETSDECSSGTSMTSFSGSVIERDQVENAQTLELGHWKPLDTPKKTSQTIPVLERNEVTKGSRESEGNFERESTESSEPKSCVVRDDCNLDTKTYRKRSMLCCNSENTFMNEMTNLKQNVNERDTTLPCQNTDITLQTKDLSLVSKESTSCHVCSGSDTSKLCLRTECHPFTKNNHSKHVVVPVIHYTRDADSDDANETQQSRNAELDSQLEEIINKKVTSRSLYSVRFSDLEYEEVLPRPNFKSAQHAKFLSASSCSDLPRKRKEENRYTLEPGVLNLPYNSITFAERTKGNVKRGSIDIYYEEIPDLSTNSVEHSSTNEITESRRQSLHDVVPELSTRFVTSRAGCSRRPSDFVQNLFWWRRPSDITDLKSTTKRSCEGQESSDWEDVCSISAQKRYSENLFCKPRRYLTLRLNRLREMWNNRDKALWHIEKMKDKQHNKTETDSAKDFELQEDKEATDNTFQHLVEKEKNEIIINTLREVVRKCTIMDPEQRPRSDEVYKKLKRLLV